MFLKAINASNEPTKNSHALVGIRKKDADGWYLTAYSLINKDNMSVVVSRGGRFFFPVLQNKRINKGNKK